MAVITVRSESDPDVEYEVDAETGTCTCPHFVKKLKDLNAQDDGHRKCKHLRRVMEQMQTEEK